MIKLIKKFISYQKSINSDTNFSIGIATTSDNFDIPYFSFPREIEGWGYYFHCIFPNSDEATKTIANFHDLFDTIFIDVEDKNPNFISQKIINKNKNIAFKKIYPNKTTVKATLDLIEEHINRNIFLFGHGSIARELALNLLYNKVSFNWQESRVSKSKNYKKMVERFGSEHKTFNKNFHNFIVNCCPNRSKYLDLICKNNDLNIIDVTGKYPFKDIPKERVRSIDVSSRICHEVAYYLQPNKYYKGYGKASINNINIVSGGYPGLKGDLIVDNYHKPTYIIGVSNGKGGFEKRINAPYDEIKLKKTQ